MSSTKRKLRVKKKSGWVSKELRIQRQTHKRCDSSRKFPSLLCSLPCEGTLGAVEVRLSSCFNLGEHVDEFVRMLTHSYATCTQVRTFQKIGIVSQISRGTHFLPETRMYCLVSKNLESLILLDADREDSKIEIPLKPYAQCSLDPEGLKTLYKGFSSWLYLKKYSYFRVVDHIVHHYKNLEKSISGVLNTVTQDVSHCATLEESGKYLSNLVASYEQIVSESSQRNLF